jgi:hypothetical protein
VAARFSGDLNCRAPSFEYAATVAAVDAREERLARNEVLFRDVNERIEQAAAPHGSDPHVYEFLCECSNIDCSLRVRMTIAAYEGVRADPRCFVVAPGHELPEIEEVLYRTDEYQVVKKEGPAAHLVAERDPRS